LTMVGVVILNWGTVVSINTDRSLRRSTLDTDIGHITDNIGRRISWTETCLQMKQVYDNILKQISCRTPDNSVNRFCDTKWRNKKIYAAIDARPKKIADRKLGKEKTVKDPPNEEKKLQLEEMRSQSEDKTSQLEKSQSEEEKSQLEEKMHSEEKKSHSDEETSLSDDKRLKEDKKQDEKKIPVSLENIKETIAEESAISDDSIQGDDHVSKIDVNKESSSDDSNVNQIDIDETQEKSRSTDAKTNVEDQILDKVCVGEDSSMATQQRTPPRNTAEGFHDVVSPKGKEFLDKVSVLLQPDPDTSL